MKNFTHENVLEILFNNGIDDEYFEKMDGLDNKEIEYGSEEWLDVLSDIVGKDVYNEDLSKEDDILISEFIRMLGEMEINLV
jgi:hypothetical protein